VQVEFFDNKVICEMIEAKHKGKKKKNTYGYVDELSFSSILQLKVAGTCIKRSGGGYLRRLMFKHSNVYLFATESLPSTE